jgi:hypothetical protein
MTTIVDARTYNQDHVVRKYTKGRRRVSIYMSWTYPGETNHPVTELDNRFSTMAELRRVLWPSYEAPEWSDPLQYPQGIAGPLELFFRTFVPFQRFVGELTGHVVPVFQRVDQAGVKLPLDERVLGDADTLLVFGLDHMVTGQEPSAAEIEAVRQFLTREGTCLVVGPHHDIGASNDLKEREMEYEHHGDPLIPRQERYGSYERSLLKGLGIPIENQWGLRPAVIDGTNRIAPLTTANDLDERGWLAGVTTFNFHAHLPHYAIPTGEPTSVRVLARQPIDLSRPHPFTLAGNLEFNTLVWLPPSGDRAGDVLVVDSTRFSTLFGTDKSLERFWRNIATLPAV